MRQRDGDPGRRYDPDHLPGLSFRGDIHSHFLRPAGRDDEFERLVDVHQMGFAAAFHLDLQGFSFGLGFGFRRDGRQDRQNEYYY